MCADTLSTSERSAQMRLVRGTNTGPERVVRKLVTSLGFRYRLHYAKVKGKPDLAFLGRRKAIWVHGCFWHRHQGCPLARLPKSRLDFWEPKLESNRLRDIETIQSAESSGWRVLVVWECQTQQPDALLERLRVFLSE